MGVIIATDTRKQALGNAKLAKSCMNGAVANCIQAVHMDRASPPERKRLLWHWRLQVEHDADTLTSIKPA